MRSAVESGNIGRYIFIDIETGEYEIGDDRSNNIHRIRERNNGAAIYKVRIGYPAVVAVGATLRPNDP